MVPVSLEQIAVSTVSADRSGLTGAPTTGSRSDKQADATHKQFDATHKQMGARDKRWTHSPGQTHGDTTRSSGFKDTSEENFLEDHP